MKQFHVGQRGSLADAGAGVIEEIFDHAITFHPDRLPSIAYEVSRSFFEDHFRSHPPIRPIDVRDSFYLIALMTDGNDREPFRHAVRLGLSNERADRGRVVEVEQRHTDRDYAGSRRLPLATVVRVLMNLSDAEIAEISQRAADYRGFAGGSDVNVP